MNSNSLKTPDGWSFLKFATLAQAFLLVAAFNALALPHDPIIDQFMHDGPNKVRGELLRPELRTPGHPLPVTNARQRAEKMYEIFSNLMKHQEEDELGASLREATIRKMEKNMTEGKPVNFYIPCFPAKSPNTKSKVLGRMPDMAEVIALHRTGAIIDAMDKIYPTRLDLISDGRIFAGTWWADDAVVNGYRDELRRINPSKNVNIRDLNSFFDQGRTDEEARNAVLLGKDSKGKPYAPTLEEIEQGVVGDKKAGIPPNPDRLKLYMAFKTFIEHDIDPEEMISRRVPNPDKKWKTKGLPEFIQVEQAFKAFTNSQKERIVIDRVLEDMKRNDALNAYLAEHFQADATKATHGETIRLSIRPQSKDPNKLGINLLHGDGEEAATPWHSTIVVTPDGYSVMEREEAEQVAKLSSEGPPHFVQKPRTIYLFDQASEKPTPVENYTSVVKSILPGDTLVFHGGRSVKVGKLLGGKTDVIYETADGKTLRIPKVHFNEEWYDRLNRSHLFNHDEFVKNGLPVVQVHVSESVPGQFTLAAKEDVRINLGDYLKGRARLVDKDVLDAGLLEFAKATAKYQMIEDFSPEQIVWNGKKWVLLDWGYGSVEFDPNDGPGETVFKGWSDKKHTDPPVKQAVVEALERAVLGERKSVVRSAHSVSPAVAQLQHFVESVDDTLAGLKTGFLSPRPDCSFGRVPEEEGHEVARDLESKKKIAAIRLRELCASAAENGAHQEQLKELQERCLHVLPGSIRVGASQLVSGGARVKMGLVVVPVQPNRVPFKLKLKPSSKEQSDQKVEPKSSRQHHEKGFEVDEVD